MTSQSQSYQVHHHLCNIQEKIMEDAIYYQDTQILATKQVKYLGVIIDGGLNYHAQLSVIVWIGRRTLSYIYS